MKQKIKHIIFAVLFLITGIQTIAQTYPVQAIPQVMQPPAVYLSDYASTSNTTDRIKLQLLLTDLTVLNREVKLKLFIEGNGIKAQSNDFVIGAQPLFLEGGIPLQLSSIDLAPFFELQNLKGVSAGAYANTLPDGLYQFCFEVYDVLSGNVISRKSCANVLVFLNDPPFLNVPENQANIDAVNPQNILFQWTPRHLNVSNVEYEFSLVEIHDNVMSPDAIFVSSPPIYQTTTQTTMLLYGLAEPQLLEGTRYAWRVQAKAKTGVDEIGMFKNNGYSEIFSFTYQGECIAPTFLSVEEVTTTTATFKWQGSFENTQYKIGYRKAIDNDGNSGTQNSFTWFESTTSSEEFTVIDLEPDTLYEWRIGGFCADGTLSFSDSKSFTSMATDVEAYYNCGIEPNINITNKTLKQQLQKGEVIKAGDFNVKITEVSGTGSFSGKGYTTVGFLKNLKVALVFDAITVNTDNQFVSGEIKTVYDPTWSNILDIDEVIDEVEDMVDVVTGDDQVTILVNYDISEDDIEVDPDKGQIIITSPDGNTHTYDYDKGDTYTISDVGGDQFSVDKEGKVTQTGTGAEGGRATAANTSGIADAHKNDVTDPSVRTIENHDISFTYRKGSETIYELDEANNEYEKANYPKVTIKGGGFYYPIHKAVAEGGATDHFYVDITNNTNYIKTDSLIFKTVTGTEITHIRTDKGYKLTANGRPSYLNEEAIITYKDTTGKQHVLSSFFIHHIKNQPQVRVKVVLVNGAKNIEQLQEKLNDIYNLAGADFMLLDAESIEIPESVWDIDVDNSQIDYNGSGILSDYPDELKAIINYYKTQNTVFDNKAYHIFVIDDSISVTKALSGFMPKTRQWGFLFEAHYNSGLENKETPAIIAAHELGHGVFSLKHPFGENVDKAGIADTWLMDYKNGTELGYPNWAEMGSDALKLGLFQDDGDNQFEAYEHLIGLNVIPNAISQYISGNNISFISSAGKIITIPATATDVTFGRKGNLHAFTIIENGKQERYVSAKIIKDGTFAGYVNEFTEKEEIKDWEEITFFDKKSYNLPKEVPVYIGILDSINGSCGINLFKGKYPNEANKEDWKGGFNMSLASRSSIKANLLSIPDGNKDNVPFGDKVILVKAKIPSAEACKSCTEGEKLIAAYKNVTDSEIQEKIAEIAYLICDAEADPSFFTEFSKGGYDKLLAWQKTFYDNGDWKNDLDAFIGFYNAYAAYLEYYKVSKEIIKTSDDREALLRIAYDFGFEQLKSLTAHEKLKMLKIISSGTMGGYWTSSSYNVEALALRVINSVNNDLEKNQISSFLNGLYNPLYNVNKKPLYVNLFNKIDDFFGDDNFTTLVLKLTELTKVDKGIGISKIPDTNFIAQYAKKRFTWDVKSESFLWIFNKVKDNSKIFIDYSKQATINLKQGCTNYELQGNGEYANLVCTEWAINEDIKPFDLVSLIIINDITFTKTNGACNNASVIACGKETLVPAAFLIFLNTKKKNAITQNIVTNSLTAVSIAFSGAEIIAAKGAFTAATWFAYADLFVTFTDPYFSSPNFKTHAATSLRTVLNTDEQTANDLATGLQLIWTVGSTVLTIDTATDLPNPQKHIEALATYKALVKRVGESKAKNILAEDSNLADKVVDGFKKLEEDIIKEGGQNNLLDEITQAEKRLDGIIDGSDWVTFIGKKIDELTEAPVGYQFYSRYGNKWVRRIDASNVNTPRLTVKEGKITQYSGQTISSFSSSQITDLALDATNNIASGKIMLGKFDQGGVSYIKEADTDFVYFYMDNWDDIYKLVNESNEEMWKINAKFIQNQFDANKTFYFSHDPSLANGAFKQEVDYILDILKAKEFVKEGKYWKVIW
ncbi:hypothetical protein FF125_20310 [Aureibaculum algae]|uniref:Fibronectin type-III domain-containing protein n=1 Tax=Aureibaculum algae TaxID=2584122 RepID=A0A5B7TUX8_9FLAO|nr:fibronectin type III domain-containing protein [Aureibaculum algae]QCX40669.1 hypothetical protein FF125_20310 [Aureibaculum algae]